MIGRVREEAATLAVAVQFLTRLPVRADVWTAERERAAVRWYPLVGALVGALSAAVLLAAGAVWTPTTAALLAVAAGLLATGAFHEDGLADTFDGMGGATRERALAIMRDSRLGTYGLLALAVALALKVAALSDLRPAAAAAALVAGHALSRASAVLVIATAAYARADGVGKFTAAGVSGPGLLVALATGAATLPLLGGGWWAALLGLAAGHALARLAFERRLGGYTGDCLGATQQLSELGQYLAIAAWA